MKCRWRGFRSSLATDIEKFLAQRRALGRRFDTEERTLRIFDAFLAEQGVPEPSALSPQFLDAFLLSRPRARPRSFNHLVGVIRRLFDWMVVQGRLHLSPLAAKPRRATAQRAPFLFEKDQARRLLELAGGLPDNNRAMRRGLTYRTIFGLMYGLGLRVGEVSRFRLSDLDLERNLLLVRNTKFGKNRLVPFGPRMAKMLQDYVRECVPRDVSPESAPLFSFSRGRPIHPGTISQTFHALVPHLGLKVPPGVVPPCVHHLRHSFAVGTLLRWYREGVHPMQRLLQLSTFLGHVNPSSTAVYLTMTEGLLREANQRFERFAIELMPEIDRE